MPTLTAKSIWKLGLLAEEKACKEDNPELKYLIIKLNILVVSIWVINIVINIHLKMEIMQ